MKIHFTIIANRPFPVSVWVSSHSSFKCSILQNLYQEFGHRKCFRGPFQLHSKYMNETLYSWSILQIIFLDIQLYPQWPAGTMIPLDWCRAQELGFCLISIAVPSSSGTLGLQFKPLISLHPPLLYLSMAAETQCLTMTLKVKLYYMGV